MLALAVHHKALQGYFEDDDLDTLTWARLVPLRDLVLNIPSLKYPPEHSRPTGYFYYGAIWRATGLDYPPYVVVLQTICLLDLALLWLLLRRIGLDPVSTFAGCLFFALHRALFDAWWKPMFIYDVLCATFTLASLLAYAHRRWILSFLAFWLAVRSKEVGIVLPAILLCYEMTVGERNWKRTLPFFLPAAVYGAFGLIYNQQQQSRYTFHFYSGALWKSAVFYFSKLLWIPYAGFAFLLLPFALRDKRVRFGVGALILGLAIYLILPGRLLEVYLYTAMIGAAVALASLAALRPAIALPLLLIFACWQMLRIHKNEIRTLAQAADRRAFVTALAHVPDSPVYVYDAGPESLRSWGVEGALRLYHANVDRVYRLEDAGLPADGRMLLLQWDAPARGIRTSAFSPAPFTYVNIGGALPPWALVAGWRDGGEIGAHATARLYRPAHANEFEWEACGVAPAAVGTIIAGERLATLHLDGCRQGRATLKPAPPGVFSVDFLKEPDGLPVRLKGFGFRPPP